VTQPSPIVLFTGVQRMARELRQQGYQTACLLEPGEKVPSPQEVEHWIPYDPRDLSSLERWAAQWPLRDRVVAVINRRERRVMEYALLNRALSKPGIRPEQAGILRDKLLLRQTLARAAPYLNPPFGEVGAPGESPPPVPFPFLIKPRNLFKSQLITLCRNPEEFRAGALHFFREREPAGHRHGVEVASSALAEALVQGQEASLDGLVTEEGRLIFTPLVRVTPAREWGMEDFHVALRSLPSPFSLPETEQAREAVARLVRSLELRATPFHVDLVLTAEGVRILDAAPRIGGYRSEMMDLAYGAPLDPLTLHLALGRSVSWEPRWERGVAVVEVFPRRPGRLREIRGLEEVKGLASFHRLRRRMSAGESLGWARDGFRCPLFVVLAHADPARVETDLATLRGMVDIEVDSPT
jgi:hypothetical protein